mgnify:CR=1 FL=1
MNKNLIYMVAIDHEKSQHNHSMFSTYSTKSWEYWCKKNNINGLALSLSGREDEEEL